jgi:hypothetical protein
MLTYHEVAVLNAHAYKDLEGEEDRLIQYGDTKIHVNDITYHAPVREVEAVQYELDEYSVLCFRGTEIDLSDGRQWMNLLDVLRDIRFIPWRTRWGWGHAGFYKGAKYWLEKNRIAGFVDKPLVVSGHSMGAQVAAWVAMCSGWDVNSVVLFAEPKGFFSSAVKHYRKKHLDRITVSFLNNQDPIRYAPPWGKTSVNQTHLGDGGHGIKEYIETTKTHGQRYPMMAAIPQTGIFT